MKKALALRVEKAKAAARFARIDEVTVDGRAKVITVPGSDGKQYRVELDRLDHSDLILTTCQCKGNQVTACYHSMAALIVASKGKGTVSFCDNKADATRRANLGGKAIHLRGQGTDDGVWTVLERAEGNLDQLHADAKVILTRWERDTALYAPPKSKSRMFK